MIFPEFVSEICDGLRREMWANSRDGEGKGDQEVLSRNSPFSNSKLSTPTHKRSAL